LGNAIAVAAVARIVLGVGDIKHAGFRRTIFGLSKIVPAWVYLILPADSDGALGLNDFFFLLFLLGLSGFSPDCSAGFRWICFRFLCAGAGPRNRKE
jgi:hypothetical protein